MSFDPAPGLEEESFCLICLWRRHRLSNEGESIPVFPREHTVLVLPEFAGGFGRSLIVSQLGPEVLPT